jgi:hypothetical protein
MEMQNESPENAGTASEQRVNLQNAKAARWLALASRCEKATGPDDDIDLALAGDLYPHYVNYDPETWLIRNGGWTDSLDAITALIERELPGWAYVLDTRNVATWLAPYARLFRPGEIASGNPPSGKAATPALSLCAAFCRAMAEKEDRS